MSDCDFYFWVHAADGVGDLFNRTDAVVEVEDLSAAIDFGFDGAFDEGGIVTANDSFDGASFSGGGFYNAHGAGAGECHVKGAGDGSGAEGEDVNGGSHFFNAFFLSYAKALFFIDDEEAEVFKMNVFTEQAVGADDEVDTTCGEFGKSVFDCFGTTETTDLFNHDGVWRHAFLKVV